MKNSFKEKLLLYLVPLLAVAIIHLLHRLMRIEVVGRDRLHRCYLQGERVIISYWHDQLLLMVKAYDGPGATALVSASRDGEFLARVIHRLGHRTVRGSSSRGGRAALREMIACARTETDLVITPDGPKGPRHEVKDGILQLARISGRPVVPLAFACSRGHRFRSWDRFLLPYPFSRGVFSYGEPIYYDKSESFESFRERVATAMKENVIAVEERLRSHGLPSV